VQGNIQDDYTGGKAVLAMQGVEIPPSVLAFASRLSTDRLFFAGERFASSKAYSSETLAGTPQALPQLLLPVTSQTSWFRLRFSDVKSLQGLASELQTCFP
jgi:hypothetical protein